MVHKSPATDIVNRDILQDDLRLLKSAPKVAEKYNVSQVTVLNWCKKFNIKVERVNKYSYDESFFTKENEATFYVAGFLAADGCVQDLTRKDGGHSYVLNLTLSQKDKDHILLIKNLLQSTHPIKDVLGMNSIRNPRWNDTWKSKINITINKIVLNDLDKFNISFRKSLTYVMPEWLIVHPLVHHFIRGYNDGDGCFYIHKAAGDPKNKHIYFNLCGTTEFLLQVHKIFEKDVFFENRSNKIRMVNNQGALRYGGDGILSKICKYLYKDSTIFLHRKRKIIERLL